MDVRGTAAIQGQGRRGDLRDSLKKLSLSLILAKRTERQPDIHALKG